MNIKNTKTITTAPKASLFSNYNKYYFTLVCHNNTVCPMVLTTLNHLIICYHDIIKSFYFHTQIFIYTHTCGYLN